MATIYFVEFQRGCKACMQTTGMVQLIQFEGYDKILDKSIPGSLRFDDVNRLIETFYEKGALSCELCQAVAQFEFYDIKVNNEAVIRYISHKQLFDKGKRIIIKYKKFKNIFASIPTSESEQEYSFSDENKGGVLEFCSSFVKVYDTIQENSLMREIFTGDVDKIDYYPNGDVNEVNGTTKHWLNGSTVNFILYSPFILGEYLPEQDNFYLVVDSSNKMNQMQANILLEKRYEVLVL